MKVDGAIRSLIQGVSQQPRRTRINGQCTLQENFRSNPVEGLQRRPPSDFIADLFTDSSVQQFYDYELNGERYIVAAGVGGIRVFDLEGTEMVVNEEGSAFDYLDGERIEFTTVEERTFLANTAKVVQYLPDTKDYSRRGSVVYILGGNYGKTFKIEVKATHSGGGESNITATYTTPDGSAPTHVNNIKTTYIAQQLFNSLTSSTNAVVTALAAARVIMVQYMSGWAVANSCTPTNTAPCSTNIATAGTRQTQIITQLNLALAGTPAMHSALTTIVNQIKTAMGVSVRNAASEITTAMLNTFDTEVSTYTEMNLVSVINGVYAERKDDHIYVSSTNPNVTVTVQTADDMNDTLMRFVNNEAKTSTNIPKYAPQGYYLRVRTGSNADSAYLYLEFRVTANEGETVPVGTGFGRDGVWFESVAPDIKYLLDTSTMPHVLSYDDLTGEFTFSAGGWLGRQVGDENSNEDPSFIGKTIRNMSYFQGRLVMLSGISCCMSRTNDPFDHYIRSATSENDDDPIDIKSTARNVSSLEKAVPFNRDLIIFADNMAQFIVFGRQSLTPKNAALVLTTTFESELSVAPVAAGRNIFFPINYGKYTGIREFFTEGSEDINDSRPITEHVIKYMPGKVAKLATTSNFNMLMVQTEASDKIINIYEYIWSGTTKLQSSWSKWILPNTIGHMFFLESIIYHVDKIGDTYSLEKIDLDTQFDTELNYQVLLDRKASAVAVDDEIVLPYLVTPSIDDMLFIQGEDCPNPGLRAEVESYDAGTKAVKFKHDYDGATIIFGQRFKSRFQPTIPFVKDEDGVKIGTGRLIISKFLVNYRESGEFMAAITSPYRDVSYVEFSGRVTNDPNTVIGIAPIQSGAFTLPFRENADVAEIEIFTDSATPLSLMDIEWIGSYTKQGQRIPQGD